MADVYGMNPVEVKQNGVKLQGNVASLSNEISKLTKQNEDLREVWKGSAAETYFRMWDNKKNSLKALQEWLNKFADATVKAGELATQTDQSLSGDIR